MALPPYMLPGDICLYKTKGLYGWFIRFHTGHKIGHVEVYVGNGESVASRDRIGVGKYPFREEDLAYILRATVPVNLANGMLWFTTVKGQPYGWADLLQFCGYEVDGKGMVCSPFATMFCRAMGLIGKNDPFNGEPANKIAPFQFKLSPLFTTIRDFVFTQG
jgi:hypothetical protein